MTSLHGLTAVAPLKPSQDKIHCDRDDSLHGLTAVAPLKPVVASVSVPVRTLSPRPHGRGSIEATKVKAFSPHLRSLHGLTAVAPLKRFQHCLSVKQDRRLHGLTAVAPL